MEWESTGVSSRKPHEMFNWVETTNSVPTWVGLSKYPSIFWSNFFLYEAFIKFILNPASWRYFFDCFFPESNKTHTPLPFSAFTRIFGELEGPSDTIQESDVESDSFGWKVRYLLQDVKCLKHRNYKHRLTLWGKVKQKQKEQLEILSTPALYRFRRLCRFPAMHHVPWITCMSHWDMKLFAGSAPIGTASGKIYQRGPVAHPSFSLWLMYVDGIRWFPAARDGCHFRWMRFSLPREVLTKRPKIRYEPPNAAGVIANG